MPSSNRYEQRQLVELTVLGVRGEARPSECSSELGIGRHSGMTDAIDRLDHVPDADRVQAAPGALGEHPRVDLEVKVSVRIAGTGCVMPDHRRFDLLDRHLHLPITRADTGRGVLGEVADDLPCGALLRGVESGRDLRVEDRCE